MMMSPKLAVLASLAGLSIAASFAPPAQAYPERPILFVIPFAPGGATDIVTRMLGPKLSERFGQQVVPDNRASAAGNITEPRSAI
jgi:tripartite-type tricarboxylate transporter receptor subunit TctC